MPTVTESDANLIVAGAGLGLMAAGTYYQVRVARHQLPPPASSQPRGRKISRRVRYLIAMGVLAVVTAVFLVFGLGRDDTGRADVLLHVIPARIARHCTATARDQDQVAAVSCGGLTHDITVTYAVYSSTAAMERAFNGDVASEGLPHGNCGIDRDAWGTYHRGSSTTVVGDVACYLAAGSAHLDWTDTTLNILARATAPHNADGPLFAWWDNAGPLPELNKKPFPDAPEQTLRAHVPRTFRFTCRRLEPLPDQGLAQLTCRPRQTARIAVYVLFANPSASMHYYRQRVKAVGTLLPGSCWKRNYQPAEAAFNSHVRRLCYGLGRRRSVVEWVDRDYSVYAYATRDDANLPALYNWWVNDSGPVP